MSRRLKVPVITRRAALAWLAGHAAAIKTAGFSAEIVGGVKTRGRSAHDLDVLMTPTKPGTSLEEQLNAMYSELRVSLGLVDVHATPMPCSAHPDCFFVGCTAGNGWSVELYFKDPEGAL